MKKKDDPILLELSERVTRLEADMSWIKEKLRNVDSRTWYILGSVLLGVLLTLLTKLF